MTTAEKIYSASTSEDTKTARLAEKLARRIEDDMASKTMAAGGVMGSLRELSERYRVGRAAVREAVALLERRGLGRLRPGPCGGFIVAQPEAETIGAELANYFGMVGITRIHLADAREALDLMSANLAAAAHPDETQLSRLASPTPSDNPLDWHLASRTVLARMTGQPVVRLFVECLNLLTRGFVQQPLPSTEGPERHGSCTHALQSALLSGDRERSMGAATELTRELDALLQHKDGCLSLPAIDTARQEDDRTLSTLVARKLAADIVRNGSAGQRVGSEWDLCERFSVSRATLRQAIRQLQDSGLVECRRGRGNGLVVRDLKGTGSIRLVLAFLIGRQMDPRAAGTILFQLNRFVPVLAVSRANDEQRGRLESLLARAQRNDPIDRYDLLRLVQCVSQLADSPIIDLFSRCLAAYEARFHPFLADRLPAHMQTEYFDLLRQLLDKMEPGDEAQLDWAKQRSSRVMLAMSRNRPI